MISRSAKYFIKRYFAAHPGFRRLQRSADEAKVLAAKGLINAIRAGGVVSDLSEIEFQVFSQFGEDGIIQYLLRHLPAVPRKFVEFGVGDYTEANTRFLLLNDNWSGMIMDGDARSMELVRREELYWRNDITAVNAFIDRDNINGLIERHGFGGDIGILSIDIDGNDYWIWEQLTVVNPAIVIVEYNSVFGGARAVTIPYDASFQRHRAHWSGQYFGASVQAFCILAQRKGYAFVGANSAGVNAFFVRKDLVGRLKMFTPEEGYVESRFSDTRDASGRLTFLRGDERRKVIATMPVYDIERNETVRVGELGGGR